MSMTPNRQRLFVASCMALVATAMSFAIRADIMGDLQSQFDLTKEQIGWIAGPAFWGFTIAMLIGGPLCDVIGMKRMVWIAFITQAGGILLTIFATGFGTLFAGTLLIGIGNGFVEAACNPLVATIYPDEKTKKLNQFHVWFPGGVMIGGLLMFAMSKMALGDISWQIKMSTMLIPLVIYGFLFLGQPFPVTERVASGVSASKMFSACLSPLFLLMALCMLLTASTELGPNQWIPNILTFSAGVSGILVLVWIHGLMAVGRQFCGPVVHKLSPSGMLFFSAVLSTIGLYLLSQAQGGFQTFGAATIFAIGVCYFWPTMLGFVAERMPKTGALGLSTMGGIGMLAVSFVLPWMGGVYDTSINEAIPEQYVEPVFADAADDADTDALWSQVKNTLAEAEPDSPEQDAWAQVQAEGGAKTLGRVAVLPVALIFVFGGLFVRDRMSGGYKAETLADEGDDESPKESTQA